MRQAGCNGGSEKVGEAPGMFRASAAHVELLGRVSAGSSSSRGFVEECFSSRVRRIRSGRGHQDQGCLRVKGWMAIRVKVACGVGSLLLLVLALGELAAVAGLAARGMP